MQGARSGLLPISYLSNAEDSFTNCIGLFSYYDQDSGQPKLNSTLVSLGYNVRAGAWLGRASWAAGAGRSMPGMAAQC